MIHVYDDYGLTEQNSFGIAAKARRYVEFTDADELADYLRGNPGILTGKWDILGGGNNILFTGDYPGTLIHPVAEEIRITGESGGSVSVNVSAGHDWDRFVEWCCAKGLWGVENLSHIPSSTGAAPVQNIGAYGAEAKDTIESVGILHTGTLKPAVIAAGHCGFGYRDSIFKNSLKGKAIITSVNFRLSRTARPNTSYGALREEVEKLGGETLDNIRRAVINIRRSKLPEPADIGNAGSFFKNPVVDAEIAAALKSEYPDMPQYPGGKPDAVKLASGWLIEKAGWKGRREGSVGVYDKQALIIVNHGGATGAEIVDFSRRVSDAVFEKFGIRIEPEVNIW